ncbi:beta strand repeat-containing protein [Novipirellula herctigrandis]|uniref:beta strand repeat-containing protein n=1 Tax=Novipirellula herctigrandis TaxID=2527986 RepID=UPI003AF3826C
MSINSNLTSLGVGRRPLLIENITFNIRAPDSVTAASTDRSGDRSLKRITSLVSQIKDWVFESVKSGENDSQANVDEALTKISALLGSQLVLGGADNAVFEGLNADQITDVEVLSLPPGGAAFFSGGVVQRERSASIVSDETHRLLRDGGSLNLNVGGGRRTINVRQGSSLAGLIRKINLNDFGVRASESDNELRLQSGGRNQVSSLSVDIRPKQIKNGVQGSSVSSQNVTQISDVDISNLSPGQSATLIGSRDSLATSATLTYNGDANGLVTGSATFDITGGLGTVNVAAIEGETLAQLATRINDVSSSTDAIAEVIDNQLFLRSQDVGQSAQVQVSNIIRAYNKSVEGVNASQIDTFDLHSIADNSIVTLDGTVTAAAETAQVVYRGGPGSVVTNSATFTLAGDLGSTEVAISEGESLDTVRDRVNGESSVTGVIASVDGDNLVFSSQDVGSDQSIQVTLNQVNRVVDAGEIDTTQLGSFNILSIQADPTSTLNGAVTSAATRAVLTYEGDNGEAKDNATITITGEHGSAEIVVIKDQPLETLRDLINANTVNTGVTATVSGDDMFLESQNYGTSGTVQVDVVSGKFDTKGDVDNRNAIGMDAQLVINGNSVTGNGNQVAYSDGVGAYVFEIADGFAGAFDSVTIRASDGNVSGVNPSQLLSFDPVSLNPQPFHTLQGEVAAAATRGELTYHGGNGEAKDDAVLTLTGELGSTTITITDHQTLDSVRDSINSESSVTGVTASVFDDYLTLKSVNYGSAGTVQVVVESGKFDTEGGDGEGDAAGTDADLQINGHAVNTDGNQVILNDGAGVYSFELAAGFTGAVDPITIRTSDQDVSGVNPTQVVAFNVDSMNSQPFDIFRGDVTVAAERGELVYEGDQGEAKDDAVITLSGELGSSSISILKHQTLDSVRDSINEVSSTTGVTATVVDDFLTLSSANYGSVGVVQVVLESGKFDTSGGDGEGNAAGVDAELQINGENITADGIHFDFSNGLGSYSIELDAGFTGALDPIALTSREGDFTLLGVDGSGTAYGVDAEATINGQNFVASGNDFHFTIDEAEVEFELALAFSGDLDTITLRSTPSDFDIHGGDGNGMATGSDGTATINGATYMSANDAFEVDVDGNVITINFVEDFLGTFDPLALSAASSTVRRSYSGRSYHALGSARIVEINGQRAEQHDARYIVEQNGVRLALTLAEGFSGQLDSFTVRAGGGIELSPATNAEPALTGQMQQVTEQAVEGLFELASGGKYSGSNASSFDTLAAVVNAISNLKSLLGESPVRGRSLSGVLVDQFA